MISLSRLLYPLLVLALVLSSTAVAGASQMPAAPAAPTILTDEIDPPIDPPADTEAPTLALTLAEGQSDPTNAASIGIAATFSEPVFGFTQEDVALSGTAGADAITVSHSGDGQNYTINITGMTTAGSVTVEVPAGAAVDAADNASLGAGPLSVAYDAVRPSVNVTAAAGQASPTKTSALNFTLSFSKFVFGLDASDLTVANGNPSSIVITGSGNVYNVALTGTATGNVTLSVRDEAAIDLAGNSSLPGSGSIALDLTAPTVSTRTPAANATMQLLTVSPSVTFSEPVTGVSATSMVLRNLTTNALMPAVVTYSTTTRVATLNPTANLGGLIVYQLELTSAIKDAVGNSLVASSAKLTTRGEVKIAVTTHTGVKFSSTGAITSSLASKVTTATTWLASTRKYYSGKGTYLLLTNGPLSGYWIKESSVAYLPGIYSEKALSPTVKVTFPVGRFTGRTYDRVTGAQLTSKGGTLMTPSSASASKSAVINGVSHYFIYNGTWANYWLRNSGTSAVRDNAALPGCGYGNVLTKYRAYGDWASTLMDLYYMVPSTYKPTDLVAVTTAGARYGTYGVPYARSLMMTDLKALIVAVKAAGYGQLKINTAFRDYNLQASWWNNYIKNGGSKTYPTTLPPGHSEHQLGTTLDIDVYAASGLNAWMTANAYKYGFIKSYPPGKNAKHCIGSEDWHYRYLGRTYAGYIVKSAMTTREWQWYARH